MPDGHKDHDAPEKAKHATTVGRLAVLPDLARIRLENCQEGLRKTARDNNF
jgi:hypothetical protein